MLELIVYEYFREIKNIFISVFIAGLCLLIAILYSFLDYESGRVSPFESIGDKYGYVSYFIMDNNPDASHYLEKRDISDYPGIEREYISYYAMFSLGDKYANTYVYDDFIWDNWHARLKEGRWFKEQDIQSDIIPIVIGGDTKGYNVGDVYWADYNGTQVKIIGILQDNTEIFDLESYQAQHFEYTTFYKAPNSKEGEVFAICQYEALSNKNIYVGENLNWGIYVYDSSLSSEEVSKLNNTLYMSSDYVGRPLADFVKESRAVARQKIYTYVPTIVVIIIMMFASIYCISYIKIQNSGKVYSVYYLNGASMGKLYGIVSGYVIVTIAFSALCYLFGGIAFDAYARAHNIMYSFWGNSIMVPLLLYIVFGATMILCLVVEMKNKTAIELLKRKAL